MVWAHFGSVFRVFLTYFRCFFVKFIVKTPILAILMGRFLAIWAVFDEKVILAHNHPQMARGYFCGVFGLSILLEM